VNCHQHRSGQVGLKLALAPRPPAHEGVNHQAHQAEGGQDEPGEDGGVHHQQPS
jgi:hypothetical protein